MFTMPRLWPLAATLAVFATSWTMHLSMDDKSPAHPGDSPRLMIACLITDDVQRLVEFYEPILALKAKKTGKTTQSFRRAWECWRFSRRTLKKSTFLVRPKRGRTGAWCCNSASAMWIQNIGDSRAL